MRIYRILFSNNSPVNVGNTTSIMGGAWPETGGDAAGTMKG